MQAGASVAGFRGAPVLLVVTRNLSTDSPWPVSSNPYAKYNQTDSADCNLNIPLWQLVRASTAAPLTQPSRAVAG